MAGLRSSGTWLGACGCRYVELTGWAGAFGQSLLTAYLVHTDVREISSIRFVGGTDAELLAAVQRITLYSQKSNLHSVPTDCESGFVWALWFVGNSHSASHPHPL